MAIQELTLETIDPTATVEEIMARTGLSRYAVELYLVIQSGDALIDDLVCIPEDQRERVLREGEEAEATLFAAAARVDPAASIEANVNRTGLDRTLVEAALALRIRAEGPPSEQE